MITSRTHSIENAFQNSEFYSGIFEKHVLSDKLVLYEFDFVGKSQVIFDIKERNDGFVYMILNLDTKQLLGLNCREVSIAIPAMANVMLYLDNKETIRFCCEIGKKYDFVLLQIHLLHFESDQKSFLDSMRKSRMFEEKLDPGRILVANLKIFETAKRLKALDKQGFGNKFIARGYINLIIGQKIKEFLKSDVHNAEMVNWRQFEIQQLQKITKEIEQHPHQQFTVKELCRKSGLSVSKLQLGFKQMHNCTVSIFIRNIRLEKALDMLHDSDLNISEIVYSVGLNSRSYFCRIFKKRYNCSPKAYQRQLKHQQLNAS